jgi:site-specific recombinase XerD
MFLLTQEMKLRGLSGKTIKSYVHYVDECLRFSSVDPKSIKECDIRAYLEYLSDKSYSASTLMDTCLFA